MAVSAKGDGLIEGPFAGLEARFNANANKIYNAYTTRDRGDGTIQNQPFLEIKPNDPSAPDAASDTRFAPIVSTTRDATRMGRFLTTPEGLAFLAEEEVQQTGNTFTETRLINPVFVIGNVVPFLHLERSFSDATQIAFQNPNGNASPASLDPNVGMAGRLQQTTAAAAVGNVVGQNNSLSSLLSTLSPANLLGALAQTIGVGPTSGPEGVDMRPELNVNGQWYSIMLWQGFQKQTNVVSNLAGAVNQLAAGNVLGAIGQAVSGVSSLINGAPNLNGVSGVLTGNRNDPNNTDIGGYRYFITDPADADRYLQNSVVFTVNANNDSVPVVTLQFLDRQPYLLPPAPAQPTLFQNVNIASSAFGLNPGSSMDDFNSFLTQANAQSDAASFGAQTSLKSPFQNLTGVPGLAALSNFAPILLPDAPIDNPAEGDMLFGNLSLDQRYTNVIDANVAFIQNVLAQQSQFEQNYWANNQPMMGFVGGLQPTGLPAPIDPMSRNQNTSYFHDRLNDLGVMRESQNSTMVSQQTINTIQQQFGTDLVNVLFYDYVNKKTIPFRAFIANIQETAIPDIEDTRYIGRIDRNVVYKGVTRELSFQLYIHAMNDSEMTNVWTKINYLTGMVFPAGYSNGYMVPPLIRLTIGDFYRDQPGYIHSLTHQVEMDTPWEITPGLQVPHGVLASITYSVIERAPAQTGFTFYPFAQPRSTGPQ